MRIKVNPTRQELLKLKKRLKTAKAGHKLLEEKLEGLMREFLKKAEKLMAQRKVVEEKMPSLLLSFFQARSNLGPDIIEKLTSVIPEANIETKTTNVMGVVVKQRTLQNREEIVNAPFSELSADHNLITAREQAHLLFDDLLLYLDLSDNIRTLAGEIESCRRRVNSLEHVYIPEMNRAKKYILQKLEEGERFDRAVLLKIKTLIN
jgi:V/A-type H+/Na+-transporting ATPase subunit D